MVFFCRDLRTYIAKKKWAKKQSPQICSLFGCMGPGKALAQIYFGPKLGKTSAEKSR